MGTKIFASLAVVLALTGAPDARTSSQTTQSPPQTRPPSQTPPAQKPPATPYKPDFDIPKDVSGGQPRQAAPVAGETYVIGPQDNLSIIVTDETELTGKYRVDTDGTISMPYLSRVPLAGMTLAEAQVKIASMLQAGYIRNPQVRIEVDQFKSRRVIVTGEVRTAGSVTMSGTTMTLLEALALAGSPTQNASNDVIVQHQAKPGEPQPPPVTVNRKDLELGKADISLRSPNNRDL